MRHVPHAFQVCTGCSPRVGSVLTSRAAASAVIGGPGWTGMNECHEAGGLPPEARLMVLTKERVGRRPVVMVHVGLDLSRTRLDVHLMDEAGAPLAVTTAVPDRGGLAVLAERIGGFGGPVYAAIESM